MSLRTLVTAALFSQLFWSQAFGWGALGHRTTGQVAEAFLSPQAKQAVSQLLQGQHLADVASWADFLRNDPTMAHTKNYHFENVEDRQTYFGMLQSSSKDDRAKGGAIEAILVSERELEDPTTSMQQKQVALKFLVHFVGDLHQPLHAGRGSDRGGNTINVQWFGQRANLHAVWDTGMIMTGHADLFRGQAQNADYSVPLARYLIDKFRTNQPPQASRDNPVVWFQEGMAMRPQIYDPRVQTDQKAYQAENLDSLDLRLETAGLRIADVLNRIFAKVNAPREQMSIFDQIQKIVGPLNQIITLGPRNPQDNARHGFMQDMRD